MQSALETRQEDRNRSMQEPRAPLSTRRDFINQLPAEVLIIVFQKSLNPAQPGKGLTRLGLVCHLWRSTVESTPSLWAHINAADGIRHVRTAVGKTGEMPIELAYRAHNDYATVAVYYFLTAAMEKSQYWKSVEILSRHSPAAYPGLQSMPCPALEKLTLWCIPQTAPLPKPFKLLNGMPAPTSLKALNLCRVSVQLESLELGRLETLSLINLGPQSMEEIIRILRTSPRLLTLVLEDLVGLRSPDTDDTPPIHLQHLETLKLRLPVPITRFLLSTLHGSKLDQLTLTANFSSIPPSMLFTPSIAHWVPVFQRMVGNANRIEIGFDWSNLCSVKFGKLYYIFHVEVFDTFQCSREILDWHLENLGEVVAALPARLSYQDVCPSFGDIRLFDQLPNITELSIADTALAEQVPSNLFNALGSAGGIKPPQWLLPHLEVIHYDLTYRSNKYLLTMLRGRYGPRGSRDPSVEQLPPPPPLRELRFFAGVDNVWAPPKNVAFLKEVYLLSQGAKIFWMGELQVFD